MARLISILAVFAMQYMKMFRYGSDGLGGHFGLPCSPRPGVKKRVTKHYIHILLYTMILFFLCRLLSCQVDVLSMTLDMQRCNELYRLIKFPYIRRANIAKKQTPKPMHILNPFYLRCCSMVFYSFASQW